MSSHSHESTRLIFVLVIVILIIGKLYRHDFCMHANPKLTCVELVLQEGSYPFPQPPYHAQDEDLWILI